MTTQTVPAPAVASVAKQTSLSVGTLEQPLLSAADEASDTRVSGTLPKLGSIASFFDVPNDPPGTTLRDKLIQDINELEAHKKGYQEHIDSLKATLESSELAEWLSKPMSQVRGVFGRFSHHLGTA